MALPNTNSLGIAALAAAKKPAKKLIPVLLSGAGLVLLGGGGVLVGLNSKLTTLQTSAQQKDAEVSSSEQIAHQYQATQDSYNQTQTHLQFLETSVSDKAYVPTLLAQLQSLAAQTHLTVSAVRPTFTPPAAAPAATSASADGGTTVGVRKAPAPPAYDTLDVAVDVSGTYADTSMFVYSLTRFPKIVSVDSVQMHPGTAAVPGGPIPVTTSLKLTAYMFHDAPAADSPQASQTGAPVTPAIAAAPVQPLPAAPSTAPMPPTPAGPVPPAASGTIGGAVGRAAAGAAAAASQADTRSSTELKTL